MSQTIKIGYQGIENSNSYDAAIKMADELKLENTVLVPLVTSLGVAEKLQSGEIDLGVAAVKNTVAGTVIETQEAFKNLSFDILATKEVHIHHCLFKKDNSIPNSDITVVASHIQALNQCKKRLARLLPDAARLELEDTAIGARYLSNGTLPETTAVICKLDAGQLHGLSLIEENIEDFENNITTFNLFKLQISE